MINCYLSKYVTENIHKFALTFCRSKSATGAMSAQADSTHISAASILSSVLLMVPLWCSWLLQRSVKFWKGVYLMKVTAGSLYPAPSSHPPPPSSFSSSFSFFSCLVSALQKLHSLHPQQCKSLLLHNWHVWTEEEEVVEEGERGT